MNRPQIYQQGGAGCLSDQENVHWLTQSGEMGELKVFRSNIDSHGAADALSLYLGFRDPTRPLRQRLYILTFFVSFLNTYKKKKTSGTYLKCVSFDAPVLECDATSLGIWWPTFRGSYSVLINSQNFVSNETKSRTAAGNRCSSIVQDKYSGPVVISKAVKIKIYIQWWWKKL